MKKAIVILVILALVGLMLLAVWLFGGPDYGAGYVLSGEEQSALASKRETETAESTQEPSEEATEPEEPLTESGKVFLINGVRLQTYVQAGDSVILAPGEEYLAALGLDEQGSAHADDKARLSWSEDRLQLQVGEKTYDKVVNGVFYLPVYEIAEDFGYPVWVDDVYGGIYITPGAKAFTPIEGVNVPVLMYHAVSDDCWGIDELFVRPAMMEEQLKYLVDNGYDPIWFEDLAHLEDYDKPVILTFDDGYDDNYTELLPLLKKYNVKATVFVIARDTMGIDHKLTEEQVQALSDSGLVSIQSHSYSHANMDELSREELEFELTESKKIIARITGKVPYVLCYPTGRYNNACLEVIKEHYNFGIKMTGGMYTTGENPFTVGRYYIARDTGLYTFAAYIEGAGKEE